MITSRLVASAKMFGRNDNTLKFANIKNIEMRVGDTAATPGSNTQVLLS